MKKIIYILMLGALLTSCSSDSSDSSVNEFAGDNDGQGGSLAIFALKGEHLYAVDESDLIVFSVATPSDPVQVNRVSIGFNIETIFGYQNYLYIGSQNGMFIYSIDNPEFPEYLSSVEHFTACDPVVANDTTAFVTLWSDLGCGNNVNQLEVYDVTEITNPVLLSTRELTGPKGMGLFGDYLFVCDDEIKIFDVSDPTNTVLVHNIDRLAFDVIIQGDLLIAIGENGVYQYRLDTSDITNTTSLSTITI
ncbi:hypothetical protein EAX61_05920 [Dokdonia sinensis]|uniref:LVIVD repeat-containing protein n=1 Tax=Dokdonia sinensis TaxID=2479847 RepID=A0A3M0GUL7_9FLAO|nr:hypothetical protein [Dokdonia sinensis]RMB61016.1 hypothetical protein EAX61_05920 [Dokdonia sinensis]